MSMFSLSLAAWTRYLRKCVKTPLCLIANESNCMITGWSGSKGAGRVDLPSGAAFSPIPGLSATDMISSKAQRLVFSHLKRTSLGNVSFD